MGIRKWVESMIVRCSLLRTGPYLYLFEVLFLERLEPVLEVKHIKQGAETLPAGAETQHETCFEQCETCFKRRETCFRRHETCFVYAEPNSGVSPIFRTPSELGLEHSTGDNLSYLYM